MSELATTHSVSPTALAAMQTAGKPAKMLEYHGVQSVAALEPLEMELGALAHGAAAHDLGWMRRVAVRGEDSGRWLSGMVTNSVKDLGPGDGAWNLVLNAQGRILGDLTVWREGDDLTLEITQDQQEKLLAHLEHFIIMDDVELARLGEEPGIEETALGVSGPDAAAVLERMGLKGPEEPMTSLRREYNGRNMLIERGHDGLVPHFILWTPVARLEKLWHSISTAGAMPIGTAAVEVFRVAEGIPLYGVDMVERDLPQETSQTRALHFNKGCYLGQEIVERIRSRGNVHRHLRQLELDGPMPAPGTELKVGALEDLPEEEGKTAGHLTSIAEVPISGAARKFALGMIRGEAEARNKPLTYTVNGETGSAWLLAAPPIF